MITPELLARINFLARKKRAEGLTAEEITEQKKLYDVYLTAIRGQVTSLLDNIEFVDTEKKNSKSKILTKTVIELQHYYH